MSLPRADVSAHSSWSSLVRGTPQFWSRSLFWSLGFAASIGIPTVLIDSPFFQRMTPSTWWNYVLWVASALLGGAIMALRKHPGAQTCKVEGSAMGSGALAYLAVGCPICNKVVVAVLGVSGALNYFAAVQPLIGILSITIMVLTLRRMVRFISRGTARFIPVTRSIARETHG